ncbi:MAG: hypothetical protein WCA46_22010 [Actinocatenispora sp.]
MRELLDVPPHGVELFDDIGDPVRITAAAGAPPAHFSALYVLNRSHQADNQGKCI